MGNETKLDVAALREAYDIYGRKACGWLDAVEIIAKEIPALLDLAERAEAAEKYINSIEEETAPTVDGRVIGAAYGDNGLRDAWLAAKNRGTGGEGEGL